VATRHAPPTAGPAFIFDMSGVLLDFDLTALKRRVAEATGRPFSEIDRTWRDPPYEESERGHLTSREYYGLYADHLRLRWSYSRWVAESAIFEAVCAAIGRPPGDCYFFDDTEANAVAARGFGMKALTFSAGNMTAIRRAVLPHCLPGPARRSSEDPLRP
jgi:FMN phosphatase YigB (HAD superfamily)